ncbi:hypothetical protein C8F01DRAFT_1084468 [Mycena amicta]|nr:hypothetical protein C8F01DRAFT_1084468 [Mycena amicta]
MSNAAVNSIASTTTSDFFAKTHHSSEGSSDEGFSLENRPAHLVVPHGISPVLQEVRVLVFPWIWSHRRTQPIQLDAVSPTLRGSGLKSLNGVGFFSNPMACEACQKPVFEDPRLPAFRFTVLCKCPHYRPDDPDAYPESTTSMRNKAIGKLAPLNYPIVQGAVVLVKHPRLANNEALNLDCPIVDVLDSDLPVADIIVGRWARQLAHDPANRIFFQHPRMREPVPAQP